MHATFGLDNVCLGLRLTAVTVPFTDFLELTAPNPSTTVHDKKEYLDNLDGLLDCSSLLRSRGVANAVYEDHAIHLYPRGVALDGVRVVAAGPGG